MILMTVPVSDAAINGIVSVPRLHYVVLMAGCVNSPVELALIAGTARPPLFYGHFLGLVLV